MYPHSAVVYPPIIFISQSDNNKYLKNKQNPALLPREGTFAVLWYTHPQNLSPNLSTLFVLPIFFVAKSTGNKKCCGLLFINAQLGKSKDWGKAY
jgi:hypothetical protein